jgi:hypothetical protein
MTAMDPDRRPKPVHAADHRHGTPGETVTAPAGLSLKSLGLTVSETWALRNPEVLLLLAEDCCWQVATEDWRLRRPPVWHRADRRAWRAVGRALQDKARRLREFGAEIGLPARRRTGLRARLGRQPE